MKRVTITCGTPEAEIRYTLDNSEPTQSSNLYSGPFTVEDPTAGGADITIKAKGFRTDYQSSGVVSYVIQAPEMQKLATPTLSLSRSGATVTGTIGNTVTGASYRYKVSSEPTSETDGTAISGTSFSFSNSSAVTVYVKGFMTGYLPSDSASASVSAYVVPTLPSPSFSLSRNGTTVIGSIGNTISGATYVYKIGSSPSSQSDGTVISGTSFSFTNSNALTVYVRGFMSGYNPSSVISKSIGEYQKPYPDVFECYEGTLESLTTRSDLVDIAYSPSYGVYVAPREGQYIQYSYDRRDWSTVDLQPQYSDVGDLKGVEYINNAFYVWGQDGLLVKSTNGIDWDVITTTFGTSNIDAFAYGNGIFVIAGQSRIGYSIGGSVWQDATTIEGLFAKKAVYWKNNFYILTNSEIYKSSDGSSWSSVNISSMISSMVFSSVAVSSDRMVFVYDPGLVFYTTNGINFYECNTSQTSGATYDGMVAYGNGVFLLMANHNDSINGGVDISYSRDGVYFYEITYLSPDPSNDYLPSNSPKCLKYLKNEFIGVGNSFETIIASFE